MFDSWSSPAVAAFLAGGALWLLWLGPLLLYQMRAYGGLNPARALGAAAVSVYGVALVAYTLLPTPGTDTWCAKDLGGTFNTDALHSIDDIRSVVDQTGLLGSLTTFTVLQVVMNIVLFVPWGILARRYFHMPLVLAALSGAFLSVAIELTQYAAGWTIIGCQYRVADIDDLLANSLGALIGAAIAPLLLSWMPRARALSADRLAPRRVGPGRRLAAIVLDMCLLWGAALALSFLLVDAEDGRIPDTLGPGAWGDRLVPLGLAVLVCVAPAFARGGATWGERLLWLTVVDERSDAASRARTGARVIIGLGVYGGLLGVSGIVSWDGRDLPLVLWLGAQAWVALGALGVVIDPRAGALARALRVRVDDDRRVPEPVANGSSRREGPRRPR